VRTHERNTEPPSSDRRLRDDGACHLPRLGGWPRRSQHEKQGRSPTRPGALWGPARPGRPISRPCQLEASARPCGRCSPSGGGMLPRIGLTRGGSGVELKYWQYLARAKSCSVFVCVVPVPYNAIHGPCGPLPLQYNTSLPLHHVYIISYIIIIFIIIMYISNLTSESFYFIYAYIIFCSSRNWPLQDIVSFRGFLLLHNNILCKHPLYCAIYCTILPLIAPPRPVLRYFLGVLRSFSVF